MFDLWGPENEESVHDESIERAITEAELDPFTNVPFADHTDERPDPPTVHSRKPDLIRQNEITNQRTVVEKETEPTSTHSRAQVEDLREGARSLGMGFELDEVDDEFDPFSF